MAPRRDLQWSSLALLIVGLFFVSPIGILAQTSTAVCLSQFDWMKNSKGQDPCLVSAYLLGTCYDGIYTTPALPEGYYYTGPKAGGNDDCQCNSVTYNTMSACGYCQDRSYINWSVWDFNCTVVYIGAFPPGIPSGTAVPHWAFQNIVFTNRFNVTTAQLAGDRPESSASFEPSTGYVTPTSALASTTASPLTASRVTSSPGTTLPGTASSSASAQPSSGGGAKTGTIAGGAVAGTIGVVAVIGAVFLFLRKRRSQNPTPAQSGSDLTPSNNPSTLFASQMPQPRFYDPSDPSTFPDALPRYERTVMTGSPTSVTRAPPTFRPGYYSGVPEV